MMGQIAKAWIQTSCKFAQSNLITVDFDHTLKFEHGGPNLDTIKKVKQEIENGKKVIVVTSRPYSEESELEIQQFVNEFGIPVEGIHHTNGEVKMETLRKLNPERHYDDDDRELEALENIEGVNAFNAEEWQKYYEENF